MHLLIPPTMAGQHAFQNGESAWLVQMDWGDLTSSAHQTEHCEMGRHCVGKLTKAGHWRILPVGGGDWTRNGEAVGTTMPRATPAEHQNNMHRRSIKFICTQYSNTKTNLSLKKTTKFDVWHTKFKIMQLTLAILMEQNNRCLLGPKM